MLAFSTDSETFGDATIVWDGEDNAPGTDAIAFTGLRRGGARGEDLTFSGLTDQLDIRTQGADTRPLIVKVTLYTDAGARAELQVSTTGETRTLSFRFSDFTIAPSGAAFDITNVGAIRLDLSTTSELPAMDVDVDFVQAASSVTVTMVDRVFDSAGNPKSEPASPAISSGIRSRSRIRTIRADWPARRRRSRSIPTSH